MAILKNTPKAASEVLVKVLESAGANAENNLNLSKNDLYVAECFANEGPTYKRYWLRSHGSADIIKKRTSHITIILDEKDKAFVKAEPKKVETKKSEEKTVSETKVKAETKTVASKTEEKKSKPATKTTATKKETTKKAVSAKSKQGGEK